ncbi:flagellar basal-body rod protein FlgB [Izhakiella capsodis]|uniref:Flagellar basal body rod protein FlgB n=1 Tax=Izhakiella capsodis TaxID=1367852 RepID=A0A1I4YBA0_9GAMM|nr:flagellar basal body rod protein FlgB [Izhakiella capsodis]SFN35286.1 flagellar basal-body rod protein FlgB [Izhakiella capsodis]
MGISFDRALGIHPAALQLRLSRAELLSANLANVDTPHFQAKDIDFAAEMQRLQNENLSDVNPRVKYRVPYQPSADGNTVATALEQAEFTKNALDYQASMTFLTGKFAGLKQAIEGR